MVLRTKLPIHRTTPPQLSSPSPASNGAVGPGFYCLPDFFKTTPRPGPSHPVRSTIAAAAITPSSNTTSNPISPCSSMVSLSPHTQKLEDAAAAKLAGLSLAERTAEREKEREKRRQHREKKEASGGASAAAVGDKAVGSKDTGAEEADDHDPSDDELEDAVLSRAELQRRINIQLARKQRRKHAAKHRYTGYFFFGYVVLPDIDMVSLLPQTVFRCFRTTWLSGKWRRKRCSWHDSGSSSSRRSLLQVMNFKFVVRRNWNTTTASG